MTNKLFRQRALEQQANRLHGEILLLPRLSHSLILGLLLVWIAAAIYWLASSNYARKETVTGWLEPAAGVIRVYAEGSGIIKQVLVAEGDRVTEGQPLAIVNGDRILADGSHLEQTLLSEYETQRGLLTEQLGRTRNIYLKRKEDIAQSIAAAQDDLALLDKQLKTMDKRYALISEQVSRYRKLNSNGHISSVELDSAMAEELELRSDLQALSRSQVNQRNRIQQHQTELQLLPEEHANTVDQLRARLSDIAQQIAQIHGRRAHVIRAPRSGLVNNLQAREGQQAQNDVALLSVVPEDAALTAQLLVPVRSVGFLQPGQSLDIRYDAFPYQKFGLYRGQVDSVSNAVLLPNELPSAPARVDEPVYRVTAKQERSNVRAYDRDFRLKPGMTLSADVRLGDRTLLRWLLEPVYSLKGRL